MSDTTLTLDAVAATALAGLVWESTKAYRQAAPTLPQLRAATGNDPALLQQLVDADITIGLPVILAGIIASWLMRSWWPLGIVVLGYGATALYHHSILSDD